MIFMLYQGFIEKENDVCDEGWIIWDERVVGITEWKEERERYGNEKEVLKSLTLVSVVLLFSTKIKTIASL